MTLCVCVCVCMCGLQLKTRLLKKKKKNITKKKKTVGGVLTKQGTFEPRPEGGWVQLWGIWRKDAPAQTKAGGLRHCQRSCGSLPSYRSFWGDPSAHSPWEPHSGLVLHCSTINQGLNFKQVLISTPCFRHRVMTRVNQFSSVQLLSRVRPFGTPWITARQDSLSITISQSSL